MRIENKASGNLSNVHCIPTHLYEILWITWIRQTLFPGEHQSNYTA